MLHEINSIIEESGALPPLSREVIHTPLNYHKELSENLNVKLFIKREDRIDDIGSGNKLRKLSYIVADAIQKKSTVLVTVGSLPSNQCKAVASIACKNNLRAHVIYGGTHQVKPNAAHGNYFLTSLFKPDISWYEYSSWQDIEKYLLNIVKHEIKIGERPYIISSGASLWPGILGSIELGFEIAQQIRVNELNKIDIVAPAGSGGTCLGIHIAAEYLRLPWKIHGICIGEHSVTLRDKILEMKKKVSFRVSGLETSLNDFYLHNIALGHGYDKPTYQELEEMQDSFKKYNLILDPNYMLKTFIGMKKLIRSGHIGTNNPVLLVHTGGQIGIFDNNPLVKQWHREKFIDWINNK